MAPSGAADRLAADKGGATRPTVFTLCDDKRRCVALGADPNGLATWGRFDPGRVGGGVPRTPRAPTGETISRPVVSGVRARAASTILRRHPPPCLEVHRHLPLVLLRGGDSVPFPQRDRRSEEH